MTHYMGWHTGVQVHQTALIGEPPQMYGWVEGMALHYPVLQQDVVIGAYSCVDAGFEHPTLIGEGSWVMKQVHVAHDVIIGKRCTIASGSTLGGYVEIGDDSKIGVGCVILPYRIIGAGCVIGAGAVVTQNVPDGETWCGNPARRMRKRSGTPFSERASVDLELLAHAGKA